MPAWVRAWSDIESILNTGWFVKDDDSRVSDGTNSEGEPSFHSTAESVNLGVLNV